MTKRITNIISCILAAGAITFFSIFLFDTFRDKDKLIVSYFQKNEHSFYALARHIDTLYPAAPKGHYWADNIRVEISGENPPDALTQQYMLNLQIDIIEIGVREINVEVNKTIIFLIKQINRSWVNSRYYYIKNDIKSSSSRMKKINDDWGFYRSTGI
ncbi:MAG: hypothetical protein LBV74_16510 [Tannerella sp.]|jgi:hypothetical protein|nr:hypothetical protein [Tannerella sp.]